MISSASGFGCENPAIRTRTRRRSPWPRRGGVRTRGLTHPKWRGLGDAPLVGAGSELELTVDGQLVAPADGLMGRDGERVRFR